MSRISDVSSKIGEYMLKGFVLTDEGCPSCSIPMLRTPSGQSPERLFCCECPATDAPSPTVLGKRSQLHAPSATSGSSEELSRVSTPPTEVSSALSSPVFAPPPNPQEILQRRAQSDMASAEIGKRMLRGWAMLAEECPNDSCYGVPLVRPPKPGAEKDPRKECVVCRRVYVYEQDAHGRDILAPIVPSLSPVSGPPQASQNVAPLVGLSNPTFGAVAPVHNRDHAANDAPQVVQATSPQPLASPSTISVLSETVKSLENSLDVLARRLAALSGQAPLNHSTIGEIAHSMEQVTNALRTVKHLHFQESSRVA